MDETITNRTWLALHFMPFIGPARYATEAISAYLAGNAEKARDKGITSTINGLIDLIVMSLFLISATHIAVECEKSDSLKLIKPILTTGAIIAVGSILIGSKIVAEQLSNAVIEKVLTVHTASSAVVNSVTITATGIEAVVETINDATTVTTNKVKYSYHWTSKLITNIINIPREVISFIHKTYNLTTDKVKAEIDYIIKTIICITADLLFLVLVLIAIVLQLLVKLLEHLFVTIVAKLDANSFGKLLLRLPKYLSDIFKKIQKFVFSIIKKPKSIRN